MDTIKYSAPLSIDFDVTMRCNQRCLHCNVNAGPPLTSELSTEEIKRVLHEAWNIGVANIAITGGEPLTRPDWKEIVNYACSFDGWAVEINTNGTLWNKEDIIYISETCPNLNVIVSLDGNNPDTYGILRKDTKKTPHKDGFNRAVANIKMMVDLLSSPISINYTVTKLNLKHFFKTAELAETLKVNRFLGIKFFPYGRGQIYLKELDLPYSDWKQLVLEVFHKRRDGECNTVSISPLCPWEIYLPLIQEGYTLKDIDRIMGSSTPRIMQSFRDITQLGCQAGITSCAIFSDGDVFPCGTIVGAGYNELACGNIKEKKLEDIWLNSPVFKRMRSVTLEEIGQPCNKCSIRDVCGGGCRGRAYKSTGKHSGLDFWCPNVVKFAKGKKKHD